MALSAVNDSSIPIAQELKSIDHLCHREPQSQQFQSTNDFADLELLRYDDTRVAISGVEPNGMQPCEVAYVKGHKNPPVVRCPLQLRFVGATVSAGLGS